MRGKKGRCGSQKKKSVFRFEGRCMLSVLYEDRWLLRGKEGSGEDPGTKVALILTLTFVEIKVAALRPGLRRRRRKKENPRIGKNSEEV